ncbi:MAG: hypothetical protein ACMUEM_01270 [Flavobacteriales bacterium AspAUS03]
MAFSFGLSSSQSFGKGLMIVEEKSTAILDLLFNEISGHVDQKRLFSLEIGR